jgi:hypothetical protein
MNGEWLDIYVSSPLKLALRNDNPWSVGCHLHHLVKDFTHLGAKVALTRRGSLTQMHHWLTVLRLEWVAARRKAIWLVFG